MQRVLTIIYKLDVGECWNVMPLTANAICPWQCTKPVKPCIPIPPEQCHQRNEANHEHRDEINAGIIVWETYTLSKAEELAA